MGKREKGRRGAGGNEKGKKEKRICSSGKNFIVTPSPYIESVVMYEKSLLLYWSLHVTFLFCSTVYWFCNLQKIKYRPR